MVRPTPERIAELTRLMKRPVATFFDFDGTFSERQLLIEFMLTVGDLFPDRDRIVRPVRKAIATYKTQRTYDYRPVIDAAIDVAPKLFKKLRTDDAATVARSVVARFGHMTYIFPRTLLQALRSTPVAERGLIIGITGAPEIVAEAFGAANGFDLVYSAVYAHENAKYTGAVDKRSIHDKGGILDELTLKLGLDMQECLALGDSQTDIPMLDRVGYAYAVNPQDTLLAWTRVHGNGYWVNDRQKNGVTMFRADRHGAFREIAVNDALPEFLQGLRLPCTRP